MAVEGGSPLLEPKLEPVDEVDETDCHKEEANSLKTEQTEEEKQPDEEKPSEEEEHSEEEKQSVNVIIQEEDGEGAQVKAEPTEKADAEDGDGEQDHDQDEEEEDEEDDVKVTIEDFKVQRQPQQAKPATIDFEASQQAVLELDLNSLEDKPWRKPGAAVSDYFNYGFDEETWKIYCEKQRKIKAISCELSSVQETYQIPVVIPDVAPVVLPPPRMEMDEPPLNDKRSSHHAPRKDRGGRLSPPKESSSSSRSRRSRSRDHNASRRSRSRDNKGSSSRRRSRSKEASSSSFSKKRRTSRSRSPREEDRRSKRHKSSRSSRR